VAAEGVIHSSPLPLNAASTISSSALGAAATSSGRFTCLLRLFDAPYGHWKTNGGDGHATDAIDGSGTTGPVMRCRPKNQHISILKKLCAITPLLESNHLSETIMTSIERIKAKPWTEWTEQDKVAFQDFLRETDPGPIPSVRYTILCNVLEAIYQCGAEGEWKEIELESLPPVVSDQSRRTANLVLCVLGLMSE
jgi:hypothetical protein